MNSGLDLNFKLIKSNWIQDDSWIRNQQNQVEFKFTIKFKNQENEIEFEFNSTQQNKFQFC